MENPNLKWMIWGYPHFRKPPIYTINGYKWGDNSIKPV